MNLNNRIIFAKYYVMKFLDESIRASSPHTTCA